MAQTTKGLQAEVKKLKARLEKAKAAKKAAVVAKKKKKVFSAASWEGKTPKKLTIYKVRLMLDEQQVGIFGPYATIRAASADAKNILRMHLGPKQKIEEIGADEPVLRSDGRVKMYFHPTVYSGQATDKGVLTAQVVEQGGEAKRKATFVKKYNPRRNASGGFICVNDRYCPTPDRFASVAEFQAMCREVFGEKAHLTRRGDTYVDGRGAVVLRAAKASRSNPQKTFKTRSGKTVSFFAKK